jgi:hypothetical protein
MCGEPGCELVGWEDEEGGVHAVVAETAELSAEDGVGSGGGRGEVEVDGLTGDGVLLEAHLGDGEAVDDVLGVEVEVDLAVGGEDELGRYFVIGGVGIGWVEAEGVAFAGGYQSEVGDAEGGVGTGVAEVPGELNSGDLDLEGCGGGSGVAGGGPEAFGLEGEGGEEEGEGGEREVLDSPEAGWFGVAPGDQADEEDQVGESQECESDPEVQEEVVIQCGAVGTAIRGQQPWTADYGAIDPEAGETGARKTGADHLFRIACP